MERHETQFEWTEQESLLPAHPGRTIAIIALALVVSTAITSWIGSSDSQHYTGQVLAHVVPITVPTDCRIIEITAEAGTWVEPGTEIARLSDEKLAAEQQIQQNTIAALEAELEQARAQATVELQWRLAELDAEILETRLKSAGLVKEQFASQVDAMAWRDFVEEFDAFTPSASRDQIVTLLTEKKLLDGERRTRAMLLQASARNAIEVYTTQISLCDDRLTELHKLKRELPENVERAAGVDEIQLRLDIARAELQKFEGRTEELSVRASAYGTVGTFRRGAGETAAAGETLVELLDDDRRYISVRVPSRSLPDFPLGSEVKVVFPGDEERTGVIKSIAPQALAVETPEGESLAELIIEPSGMLWPQKLIVGSSVTVNGR